MPSYEVQAIGEEGGNIKITLNGRPDQCPVCHIGGQPNFVTASLKRVEKVGYVDAIYRCPSNSCRKLYVANYAGGANTSYPYYLINSGLPRFTKEKEFPANIVQISPSFVKIFNQSLTAEENELDQICGPGYRKALEFLIKDFLVMHKFKLDVPTQEKIKAQFLSPVIKDFVTDDRVKRCAELATWLGNDETHYVKKWENKDVQDLKALIHLTVNYIDSEIESDRYVDEMSKKKK